MTDLWSNEIMNIWVFRPKAHLRD